MQDLVNTRRGEHQYWEVVETIAMLKSGKAPGICEIDVEMLIAARMNDDS